MLLKHTGFNTLQKTLFHSFHVRFGPSIPNPCRSLRQMGTSPPELLLRASLRGEAGAPSPPPQPAASPRPAQRGSQHPGTGLGSAPRYWFGSGILMEVWGLHPGDVWVQHPGGGWGPAPRRGLCGPPPCRRDGVSGCNRTGLGAAGLTSSAPCRSHL